ncbi:MAG TPA: glycosyltransferase family 2 protein [Bryobacterales bacterium]|nr:glycosyltransferase family 2 protein [Bryobacterales bacterium]
MTSTSSGPLVSVVVVNWDRADLLRACLASLAQQTFRDFEIIVVDNGSRDGSAAMVASEFPAARVIANAENRGFCAANNQGIAAARGRYVALLNNDAEADARWIEEMLGAFRLGDDVGMAASKILIWENRGAIDKAGHLIYPDGQNRGRGAGEEDRGQYERLEETAWPDGCAAMYRKGMLGRIGGFDEDFFAYADDAELGLRARIGGWRCLYVPTAIVFHHHGATLGRFSAERLVLIERNRLWLAGKLFPWRLLALNPFYFAARVAAGAWSAARGAGEAARFTRQRGAWVLVKCFLRANLAAVAGLPRMLAKRRDVARIRRLSASEICALLRRFRIPLRDLALKTS